MVKHKKNHPSQGGSFFITSHATPTPPKQIHSSSARDTEPADQRCEYCGRNLGASHRQCQLRIVSDFIDQIEDIINIFPFVIFCCSMWGICGVGGWVARHGRDLWYMATVRHRAGPKVGFAPWNIPAGGLVQDWNMIPVGYSVAFTPCGA